MVEIGADSVEKTRPQFKLIVGGGHIDPSHPTPELTVVARRPEPIRSPEPLESA
jgi:hypothetical protein